MSVEEERTLHPTEPTRKLGSRPNPVTLLMKWHMLMRIIRDPQLTETARRVAAELLDHLSCRTGQCDPGYGRLAERLGIHRGSVARAVKELVSAGYLVMENRRNGSRNQSNTYAFDWRDGDTADATGAQTSKPTGVGSSAYRVYAPEPTGGVGSSATRIRESTSENRNREGNEDTNPLSESRVVPLHRVCNRTLLAESNDKAATSETSAHDRTRNRDSSHPSTAAHGARAGERPALVSFDPATWLRAVDKAGFVARVRDFAGTAMVVLTDKSPGATRANGEALLAVLSQDPSNKRSVIDHLNLTGAY